MKTLKILMSVIFIILVFMNGYYVGYYNQPTRTWPTPDKYCQIWQISDSTFVDCKLDTIHFTHIVREEDIRAYINLNVD